MRIVPRFFIFFFNDTATTEIYTLSLHDALPILGEEEDDEDGDAAADADGLDLLGRLVGGVDVLRDAEGDAGRDRKSTRLNSSHANISYAVFCLKKKNRFQYLYTRHKTVVIWQAV